MAIVKKGTGKKKPRSADSKISAICNLMAQLDYNPKSFMQAFLKHNNVKSAVRRRYWGTMKGWPTTIQLLGTIRGVVSKKAIGKKLWEEFILAKKLKEKYRTPGCKLNNLRPSTIGVADPTDHLSHNNNSEDVSEAGDNEPEIDENEPQTADEDESLARWKMWNSLVRSGPACPM
ncbi:hypothetical protein H4Q26_000191 [Puccinia striiformis f. sp. tritici PST-130]|nr:hypothetical protein H4Q26_000191 [Puccinia striiformis f. sp. tritici PST-130]